MKAMKFVVPVLVVGALAAGAFVLFTDRPEEETEETPRVQKRGQIADAGKKAKKAKKTVKEKRQLKQRVARPAVSKERIREQMVAAEFTGRDLEISEQMQEALDADDWKKVEKIAAEAMKSSNPELRKEALDALAWFGDKALAALTGAMADRDPEVAEAALSHADSALSEIEDPGVQFDTAAAYMTILSSNENALDTFCTTLSTSADTLCTPEDEDNPADVQKAADNRVRVIDQLTTMISSGGKLAESAKEAYSFVTGNDWAGAAEARSWAADPDGYEPPEE